MENLLPDLGECGGGRVMEEEHGSVVGGDVETLGTTLYGQSTESRESGTSFVHRLQ